MKRYWFVLFFALIFTGLTQAQNSSIIKDLNSPKQGQGSITVYQDESIDGLIGAKITSTPPASQGGSNNDSNSSAGESNPTNTGAKPTQYIQSKGYKIQVFSGNDQKKSKNEAYSKKSLIEGNFPDMEVAITFNSPVWRVRAGNFKTYEQAFQALKDLKNAFPSFGREMQIVESVIKLPVY